MHYFFPFRQCLECVQGPSYAATQSYAQLRDHANSIKLSTANMGSNVVLLKNCTRICGSGGALATAPIVQNKAFYQVDIMQNGVWGVGVARRAADLERVPIGEDSWLLRSNGEVWANGECVGRAEVAFREGDTLAITFDHVNLTFYHNGAPLPIAVHSVRGQVFPCLYVGDSAILDVRFRNTSVVVPSGFEEILLEQTLL